MPQVRIRMYRTGGIGDFFLLTFPTATGVAHMLIDCGVLKGTDAGKARMQALVNDIADVTNERLDVLVVTHEHWDHVSGFVQAPEEFKRLKIGEVWMAWTEEPDDEVAKALREHKAKARAAVTEAVKKLRLAAGPATEATIKALSSLNQFDGDFGEELGLAFGAAGRPTTAGAMRWAREEASKQVSYLCPGDAPLSIPGVDGVRVFVLGPPRDTTLLKRSDPSKRTPEVYHLAGNIDTGFAAALIKPDGVDAGRPFDASFELPVDRAAASEHGDFFRLHYAEAEEWRQIESDWLHTADRLALQLDSDTNNTSLVLAIELVDSGRVLLFPGDAQVGNWLSWESDACTWNLTDRRGAPITVKAKDLLARTVLYKVGHHASHNATLSEKGLELMTSRELMALIPVYREQALEQGASGWDMPFGPLLTRLLQKTADRVARTDTGVPRAMADCCREEPDHIECMIDL